MQIPRLAGSLQGLYDFAARPGQQNVSIKISAAANQTGRRIGAELFRLPGNLADRPGIFGPATFCPRRAILPGGHVDQAAGTHGPPFVPDSSWLQSRDVVPA